MTTEARDYIGRPLARPGARRLVHGRGTYVDDIELARMAHIAFLRSPHAHADIVAIDTAAARAAPGVLAVATGRELASHYKPWIGTLAHQPALRSVTQHALAIDRARWHGEPIAAVVAATRAEAEDAVERIAVEWRALPALTDAEAALRPDAVPLHPTLGNNLAFAREVAAGDVDAAMTAADLVVEEHFRLAATPAFRSSRAASSRPSIRPTGASPFITAANART